VLPLQREISLRAELPQSNWQIRRLVMSTKIYLIYMLLMCTLLVLKGAPEYLILVQLLATRNIELRNKRGLAKNEVTMCIGSVSKVDVITVGTLSLPSGLVET
jgi:hypothetical protein